MKLSGLGGLLLSGCLCSSVHSAVLVPAFHTGVNDADGGGYVFTPKVSSLLQAHGVAVSTKVNNTVIASTEVAASQKQKLPPKTWFAITVSTALIVKTLCMVMNVIFQVSPFPTVKEFYARGDTGQADAAPYMSIFFGGCQWCFYGMYAFIVTEKSGFLVLVYSNFLGAILGAVYTYGYWQNCQDFSAVQRLYKYFGVVVVLVLMQVVAMCTLQCQESLFFSGLVSSICSIMISASMLATVPLIFETRCSASIDVHLTSVAAISSVLWLTCGCILKDKWILAPNTVGLCILLFTLSLAVYFPRDPEAAEKLINGIQDDALPARGIAEPPCPRQPLRPGAERAVASIRSALAAARNRAIQGYGACSSAKALDPYGGDTGGTF